MVFIEFLKIAQID